MTHRPAPQKIFFAGPGTVDLTATPEPGSAPTSGKQTARIRLEPGGGACNAAGAYIAAGGGTPALALLTGADEVGSLLTRLVASRFTLFRLVALSRTRMSLVVPDGGGTRTYTARPVLDEQAAWTGIRTHLKSGHRFVLASFTHSDLGLVSRLIDANPGDTCLSLTADQCRHPGATIPLMRRVWINWLNVEELELLTGEHEVTNGVKALRDSGVNSVIVTDGPRGATGFVDGQWIHGAAYGVTSVNGASKCGDIAFGTFLAGVQRGESLRYALRGAMAAAAMHLARIPRAGWASIEAFARSTSTMPYVPPRRRVLRGSVPNSTKPVRKVRRSFTYMAAGAAIALVAVQWLSHTFWFV